MYTEIANQKYNKIKDSRSALILAIETSCDETAAAVVKNGREVLSSQIYSQIPLHQKYGGVVPEIASRSHTQKVNGVVAAAIEKSGVRFSDIDAVAVTMGAGLNGSLLVGVSYAKAAAYTLNVPLVGVNHIRGHIAANYIADKQLQPPFVCLVVSGGHTAILDIKSYNEHDFLGGTHDDAAGEAFDKVARVLKLGYPGGPAVQSAAKTGKVIPGLFPKIVLSGYNFSYSGLKTAVVNYVHKQTQNGSEINVADVCATFQSAAIDIIAEKALSAVLNLKRDTLCIAGGVSANLYLRDYAAKLCREKGIKLVIPPLELCTDNAAMIGAEAYFNLLYKDNMPDKLSLNSAPGLRFA